MSKPELSEEEKAFTKQALARQAEQAKEAENDLFDLEEVQNLYENQPKPKGIDEARLCGFLLKKPVLTSSKKMQDPGLVNLMTKNRR